ncbi:MAG: DEAD/DEAH box helicase [Leptospirales bacterium]
MGKSDIEILEMLHPTVQREIQKKWADSKNFFRPVQREVIPVVVNGSCCLVISPTAGGKTEAALFPVLSNIFESASKTESIHAIFIAPLKALLNDLDLRIEGWLENLGDISIFKWHGDVSAFSKNKQKKNPASILLTTPESLDVMLASESINNKEYFKNVVSLVVDEAHYFAADSRGAQLSSSMERLQSFVSQPIQRIGLSATVGDPEAVATWLQGSGPDCEIINAAGNQRSVSVEHILINEEGENYGAILQHTLKDLTVSGKTIIFGNSKKDVEMTACILEVSGIHAMVHHGSVSKLLREETEEKMRTDDAHSVISATSTLELGIDIGDLNRVIQKDHLPSVNSYLQRIGRAGRRDGNAHIVLLTKTFEDFVLNMAMSSKGAEGYFEPLRPSRRRYDILFQQLLLEILGNYGINPDTFFNKIKSAYSFSEIKREEFDKLIEYWVSHDFLFNDGRVLLIGPIIEKKFSHKNYMELYAVFDVNENYTVLYNNEEIGFLESWFAFGLNSEESVFQLAGRKWAVQEIIEDLKCILVKPAADALPPAWSGGGLFRVEYEVARRFHDILASKYNVADQVSPNALQTLQLHTKRLGHNPVEEGKIGVTKMGTELWIETYAGTMINTVIAFCLCDSFPGLKVSHNFYRLEFKLRKIPIPKVLESIHEFISSLHSMTNEDWIKFLGRHLDKFHYSRFSDFIPTIFSVHHAAESFYVLDDLKKFASLCKKDFINFLDSDANKISDGLNV